MVFSTIGRKLLNVYNEKNGTSHTPESFFDEVFYPILFEKENCADIGMKLLNDVFHNGGLKNKTPKERLEGFKNELDEVVEKGEVNGSIAAGYPAKDPKETEFTFLIGTDRGHMNASRDEVFLSWFGISLLLEVEGGWSFIFQDRELIYKIFEGWEYYSRYIDDYSVKGNQVNAWNTNWLVYYLTKGDPKKLKYKDFEDKEIGAIGNFDTKRARYPINNVKWVRLYYALTKYYGSAIKTSFIYRHNTGKGGNTTVGPTPIRLDSFYKLLDVYQYFYGKDKEYEIGKEMFDVEYGSLKNIVETSGVVGLDGLEPRVDHNSNKNQKTIGFSGPIRKIPLKKANQKKKWFMAKTGIEYKGQLENAKKMAEAFKEFKDASQGGRTNRSNKIEGDDGLLNTRTFDKFRHKVSDIIGRDSGVSDELKNKVKDVVTFMAKKVHHSNFSPFMGLVKLCYYDLLEVEEVIDNE